MAPHRGDASPSTLAPVATARAHSSARPAERGRTHDWRPCWSLCTQAAPLHCPRMNRPSGRMGRWIVGALLLAAVLLQPAQAQWKWRDKNGQTQYSDLPPPPNVPEQDILSRPQGGARRSLAAPAAAAASS